VGEESQLFWHC